MTPISIYVHVPYCRSICPYCDFNSYVQPKPPWVAFTQALQTELKARAGAFSDDVQVRSVYFGGGTPSLAPSTLFSEVLGTVRDCFAVESDPEITIEVNPGSVTADQIGGFLHAGINRISLGWQSTHDRLLRVLGRGHSADDSMRAFAAVRAAGCTNVSADLIFAVPGQSMDDLDADLTTLIQLQPEHISLYALTYHEGTPLYQWRRTGRVTQASEDIELAMMARIAERLAPAGYGQYEISNYSKPGFRAIHNTGYWTGVPYLGIGPGAHGFVHQHWEQGWRWEVRRDPKAYVTFWNNAAVQTDPSITSIPTTHDGGVEWVEQLTARQMLGERMLCGMRMGDGVSTTLWDTPAFVPFRDDMHRAAATAQAHGWAVLQEQRLIATPLGLQHVDSLGALFV